MRIPADGSYQNMRVNGMAVLGIDLEENQEAWDIYDKLITKVYIDKQD